MLLAGLLFTLPALALPGQTTEETLQHHLAALESEDIDEIMADYHPHAVVFVLGGTVEGRANIRVLFEGFAGLSQVETLVEITSGRFAQTQWEWCPTTPFGTDTFYIVGGLIRAQTVAFVPDDVIACP